jgi:uncharacterized protein (TIGR02118 family)
LEDPLIKFSVLYPNQPGKHFDMAYYCAKHMPMVKRLLGAAVLDAGAEEGVAGLTPGSEAPFVAIGILYLESVAAFEKAFAAHSAEILADIANFTNIEPMAQISEVRSVGN